MPTLDDTPAPQPHDAHSSPESIPRNPGFALDLDWVAAVQVNTSAAERRAATLPKRRSVKKAWQAAWLLRAISVIDLTTLAGDDTEELPNWLFDDTDPDSYFMPVNVLMIA